MENKEVVELSEEEFAKAKRALLKEYFERAAQEIQRQLDNSRTQSRKLKLVARLRAISDEMERL